MIYNQSQATCEHTQRLPCAEARTLFSSLVLGKEARLEPKAALAKQQLDQAPCWRAAHRELRDRNGERDAGAGHGEPNDAAQAQVADERKRAPRGVHHLPRLKAAEAPGRGRTVEYATRCWPRRVGEHGVRQL